MERPFSDPFMLKSEHVRVLSSAQERYDSEKHHRERIGFWKGVAACIGPCLFGTYLVAIAAFTYGLGYQT